MQSQSSGTVTAIFMLMPMVAVPYFAIRGTRDIQGRLPSLSGEDVAFASTDDFGDAPSASMDDAPPFPGDDSVVLPNNDPAREGGWGDPFASNEGSTDIAFGDEISNGLDAHSDQARSGLGGTLVRPGSGHTSHEIPADRASQSRIVGPTVAEQWKSGIAQLKGSGMRNYLVESLKDRSMFFVTAFFPQKDGVMRRFEGQGKHPLDALRSVMQQVAEFRSTAGR